MQPIPEHLYGGEIKVKDIRAGDEFVIPGNRRTAQQSGKVEKVARVNILYSCDVQFSPTGPVYHQEHKEEKSAFVGGRLLRDGLVYEIVS